MITELSAHRVSRATIEGPFEYDSRALTGNYQRIRLYDAQGRESACITIHFNDGAKPLPVTEQ